MKSTFLFAWRPSLRRVGLLVPALSALVLAGLITYLAIKDSPYQNMAVEIVIPLAAAAQAALLLSPNDEPALEVLLSTPRPAPWLLLERVAVVLALQGAVALVGMVASMAVSGETDVLLALARWLPPMLFFCGIATALSVRSRESALALAVTVLGWAGMLLARGLLLPAEAVGFTFPRPLDRIQPVLWLVHPYLQPGMLSTSDYVANRLVLAGVGCLLIALAADYLRDTEQTLLGVRGRRMRQQPLEEK